VSTSAKVMIALAILFTVLYLWAEFLDNVKVGQ
jgi:hypothetical protein